MNLYHNLWICSFISRRTVFSALPLAFAEIFFYNVKKKKPGRERNGMQGEKLEINKEGLTLGGKPFYLASGSMHYFRIHPAGWEKRLRLMKDFGLTAVQTYVPWNLHEKKEGKFDFSGMLDLGAFLRLCGEVGLKVMLRPAPFICSEWDFGGMPWWLLKEKNQALRCMDERFCGAVRNYYRRLCPEFVPYLSTNGGPVIAVDIENEYGGYGNDQAYLLFLKAELEKGGVDVPFYTTDGNNLQMLRTGTLPGVWAGVNYRIESREAIANLRKVKPEFPAFVGEYWSGRSTYFGETFAHRQVAPIAKAYREALEEGAYVNFYMFCGGTNFGFMNGARITDSFVPTGKRVFRAITTSYDTDALVGEDGYPTPKYFACRKELDAYLGKPVREEEKVERQAFCHAPLSFDGCAPLFDNLPALSSPVQCAGLRTFEQLDVGYGFVLYEAELPAGYPEGLPLKIVGLHDRAQVFLDGEYKGVYQRDVEGEPIMLATLDRPARLSLLVENMGRNNTGPHLRDEKGILEEVRWGAPNLFHWTHWPLPMEDLSGLNFENADANNAPAFYHAAFEAEKPMDAHLVMEGCEKGAVWLNGFNLGRYWRVGPQQSLYVPGGLMKEGRNELIVLDLMGGRRADKRVRFADRPQWDITE